jgi:non-ribosomal peptide synthetase component E (peptide arylation enzyme)
LLAAAALPEILLTVPAVMAAAVLAMPQERQEP